MLKSNQHENIIGENKAICIVHHGRDKILHFQNCSLLSRYGDETNENLLDIQWFHGTTRPKKMPHKRHYEFSLTIEDDHKKHSFTIRGKVLAFIPLRNRRLDKIVTLGEAYTEYHVLSSTLDFIKVGSVGYGMSEYLDHEDDPNSKL